MRLDKCNQYDLAYSQKNPSLPEGCRTTTWVGHRVQILGLQNRLRNLIAKAEKVPCPIPPVAYQLAWQNLPNMPRGR